MNLGSGTQTVVTTTFAVAIYQDIDSTDLLRLEENFPNAEEATQFAQGVAQGGLYAVLLRKDNLVETTTSVLRYFQ